MNKGNKEIKLKFLLTKLFFDKTRILKIVKYWICNQRITSHSVSIVCNKYTDNKEVLIMKTSNKEYEKLFYEIVNLKYNIIVNVLGISFFKSRETKINHHFFTIPFKFLTPLEIKIINNWVQNKSFKTIYQCETNPGYFIYKGLTCSFEGDDVDPAIKNILIGTFLDLLVKEILKNSAFLALRLYDIEFTKGSSSINHSGRFLIHYRNSIMYWFLNIILSSFEIGTNDVKCPKIRSNCNKYVEYIQKLSTICFINCDWNF